MKRIQLSKMLGALGLLLALISIAASFYFFHVAQVREEKDFINNAERSKKDPLYDYEQRFNQLTKKTLWMTNQGVKQDAWYVPAEKATNKTVIAVHGFTNDKSDMRPYAWMFHELGYNVLMPDNIAHGDSQGQIIGYGWNDRRNVVKWAELLVGQNPNCQITLFGVSMGAATVMMASGEEDLPRQVVSIIEDCGYSSVWEELKYQAKDMYHLPAFPILYEVSAISKIRAGFSYGQASSVKQLQKNDRPTLFIHGDKDSFVPTNMVYDNYQATQGEKEIYIVKGAGHAKSFATNPEIYIKTITSFLKKYEK